MVFRNLGEFRDVDDRRQLLGDRGIQSLENQVNLAPSPSSPSASLAMSPAPWWSALAPSLQLSPARPPAAAPTLHSPAPAKIPLRVLVPPRSHKAPPHSSAPSPSLIGGSNKNKDHKIKILTGITTGVVFFFIIAVGISILIFRSSKVVTVKPWATGLSGQLQKAFVTGLFS